MMGLTNIIICNCIFEYFANKFNLFNLYILLATKILIVFGGIAHCMTIFILNFLELKVDFYSYCYYFNIIINCYFEEISSDTYI